MSDFRRRPLRTGNNTDQNSGSPASTGSDSSARAQGPSGGASFSGPRPTGGGPRPPGGPRPNEGNREASGPGGGGQRRRRRRRGGGRGHGGGQGLQGPGQPGQAGVPGAGNHAQGGQPQGAQRQQGQGGRPHGGQQQGQRQHGRGSQGQRGPQGRGPQSQRGQQGRGQQNRNQHQQRQQPRRAPAPPPAYYQRSLLLVVAPESAGSIDQVRAKFDPLTKKVPAHVTLVFPEPAACIDKEHIKKSPLRGLPAVEELTFTHVVVHNDKYLFLIPDEEGKQRLIKWREVLLDGLPEDHTQWDEFMPHLTLGYVPRSMTPDEAVGFARTHIQLPVTLKFKDLLLEEFGEDQLSKELDVLPLNGPMPEGEPRAPRIAEVAEPIPGPAQGQAAETSAMPVVNTTAQAQGTDLASSGALEDDFADEELHDEESPADSQADDES